MFAAKGKKIRTSTIFYGRNELPKCAVKKLLGRTTELMRDRLLKGGPKCIYVPNGAHVDSIMCA
jgi:hypothetical protein